MNPKPIEQGAACTKQNDCKAALHFGDCASMPSPTMPIKREAPERLTVNVCIRCGVLNVGLNDCRSCAMPPNLSETAEYVHADRYAKVVEALRGLVTVVVAIQDNPDVRFSSETKKAIRDADAALNPKDRREME